METSKLLSQGCPPFVIDHFQKKGITTLNPPQVKAVEQGILEGKNILACTPTGSGKTAMATLGIAKCLSDNKGAKAIYLVPLKALASEKYKEFQELFQSTKYSVGISTGDLDSSSEYLNKYDLVILTVEKLDSLIRHKVPWIHDVRCLVVDEIHLLNDPGRGPTLEVMITLLKKILKQVQLIALSATIGNPKELAGWLNAELVIDDWRPVKLHKGVYFGEGVEFVGNKQ